MSALSGRFDDFELLIAARREDGSYPAMVIASPAGEAQGELRLPFSEAELGTALERMHALQADQALLTDVGSRMFAALFAGDVATCYAESVGRASQGKGLRIRLRLMPPELAALPWELLYDPDKREFLGFSKRALVTRYLPVARPPAPLQTELPLRILVVIAAPRDLPPLDAKAEVSRIRKALARPVLHKLVHFQVLHKATTRALREALREPYHVLHFIGHGDFDQGVGSLAFEDEQGNAQLVSGETLGNLLKNTPVRLVVLNACKTAQDVGAGDVGAGFKPAPTPAPEGVGTRPAPTAGNVRGLAGVGPALVEAGIPAVVAMQFAISDDSAAVFTQDLYEMLSRYLPIDECVAHAREGLMLKAGVGGVDWATPVLFLRAPDGVIFVSQGVDLSEEAAQSKIRPFQDVSISHRRPVTPTAGLPGEKEIINHLWAVSDYPAFKRWAEPHEALSRWVAPYEAGRWDELTRQDVTVVVEREPVTLLLAEAGMGKTAILELLAFIYAERALRGAKEATIPVFVKLSQHAGEDSLLPLIRAGLRRHAQICLSPEDGEAQTRSLLARRRFIILIDGLHHIPGDEAQRAQGVAMVKRFLEENPAHKYVITCHILAYDQEFWAGKAWVVLPHSDEDVRAFILRRFGELRGAQLFRSLPERMRDLARTPVLLAMLLDELRDRGEEAARRLAALFANFVARLLSDQEEAPVSVENQKVLLAGLAYAMRRDQTQEYTLEQALEVLGRQMAQARLWKIAPQEVLDALIDGGLLRIGSTARIAFSSLRFQDYFAALALQEEYAAGRIDWAALAGDPRWHEALLMLADMVEAPEPMIRQVLAHDPLLAAECLLASEVLDVPLRDQIVEALAARRKDGRRRDVDRSVARISQLGFKGEMERRKTEEILLELGALPARSAPPPAPPPHPPGPLSQGEKGEILPSPSGGAEWPVRVRVGGEGGLASPSSTDVTLPMRRGFLEVPRGPLAGLRLPLMDGTFVFGRGSQAGIELPDKSVSRRHAEIRVEGDQISLRDLGSTNGTRVNGQLITTWRTLRDGDEIQLGDLPLVVQLED